MEQRATESAKPPGAKRRRKRAAKSELAGAPTGPLTATEFEQADKPNEPGNAGTELQEHSAETPGPDRSAGSDLDERYFANVTASLVERGRPDIVSLLVDSSRAEPQKSTFLNSTSGLLVYKGEAEPSVIDAPDAVAQPDPSGDEMAAPLAPASDQGTAPLESEGAQAESRTPSAKAEHGRKHAKIKPVVDGELHHLRRELSALQATLADREGALAQAASNLEQARARWEREREAAESAWRRVEAERVAQSEAQLRKELARASQARAEADSAHDQEQTEMARLQAEAATLHSTLQARERAFKEAASDHQQALKTSQQEAEAALLKAEQDWKAAENARNAEAAAKWHEQSASALAEVRAQAEAARNRADEELRSLNDELAALRGTLADRDKVLAKAALEREQVREQAEAVRNRAEGEIRNLNGQLGRLRGTVADRDKALAKAASETEQVREQAEAARNRADGEVRNLNDQLAATIADRDAALAKAGMETERVREQSRQDVQAVLARAEAREAGEAARLAAAEAAWRHQSAAALNEATARYQSAEGMLTQLRLQADRARTDAVGGSIRPSGAASGASGAPFGARAAQREIELAPAPMPTRADLGLKTQDGSVVLRPSRIMAQQDAPRRRRVGRDVAVVAMLAALVAVAYPKIEPLLPYDLRVAIRGALVSTPSASAPNRPTQDSALDSALVTAEVNLRAGPTRGAEVLATLPRGLQVTVFERRDDWILVRVEGDRGKGQRQGWVFGSFLQDVPEVQDAPELRSSALSVRQ